MQPPIKTYSGCTVFNSTSVAFGHQLYRLRRFPSFFRSALRNPFLRDQVTSRKTIQISCNNSWANKSQLGTFTRINKKALEISLLKPISKNANKIALLTPFLFYQYANGGLVVPRHFLPDFQHSKPGRSLNLIMAKLTGVTRSMTTCGLVVLSTNKGQEKLRKSYFNLIPNSADQQK